jgi:protein involved in polysaccharide export with SLBB domain
VIVAGGIGPYSEQIRVIGEAAKPQALAYKQKMTLLDVMIAVGGITDFADGNAATILRTAEGDKQYNVRLKDLVRRGDVSRQRRCQAGRHPHHPAELVLIVDASSVGRDVFRWMIFFGKSRAI